MKTKVIENMENKNKLKYDHWTRRLLMDEIKSIAAREGITLPKNLKSLRRNELRFALLRRSEEFLNDAWDFYRDLSNAP